MTEDDALDEVYRLRNTVRWLAVTVGAEPCEVCGSEGRNWHGGSNTGWWERCYSCNGIGFKKPEP